MNKWKMKSAFSRRCNRAGLVVLKVLAVAVYAILSADANALGVQNKKDVAPDVRQKIIPELKPSTGPLPSELSFRWPIPSRATVVETILKQGKKKSPKITTQYDIVAKISIHERVVFVNGMRLDERYVAAESNVRLVLGNLDIEVPKDSFFMMGDNRDMSNDSRFWGFVPRDNLLGKVELVWMHYDPEQGFDASRMGVRVH